MSQPDELETRLRRAMHTEADATPVSPDALAQIRGRIAPATSRASAGWFRPAVAGSALAFTLVVGTLAGVRMAGGDGGDDNVAEPPSVLFNPAATGGPDGSGDAGDSAPASKVPGTAAPETLPGFSPERLLPPAGSSTAAPGASTLLAPNTPTHKVPEDTGGPYVSILGPDSGTTVGRTVELTGKARTFEANVVLEVSQNGSVVKRDFTTASAGAPALGTWTKVLVLEPGAYRIDAFEESMEGNGTRLASDSIWITVAGEPQSATGGGSPGGTSGGTATTQPTSGPTDEPVAQPQDEQTAPPTAADATAG